MVGGDGGEDVLDALGHLAVVEVAVDDGTVPIRELCFQPSLEVGDEFGEVLLADSAFRGLADWLESKGATPGVRMEKR